MKLKNSHKAFAITTLLVLTMVLLMFNLQVSKQNNAIVETFIDITPEVMLEENQEKKIEVEKSLSTNKAYNESKEYKHFAQAFKPIAPPKDYVKPKLASSNKNAIVAENQVNKKEKSNINNSELSTFNKVNNLLERRVKASQEENSKPSVNKNSSISYSLIGRTDTFLPIPIYLCESSGKVVVNITVNKKGEVISVSINSSSTSLNQCLQQHALEHAKKAKFSLSNKNTQIGTITFLFEGK